MLLAHGEQLKKFGLNLEKHAVISKEVATAMAAIGLGLAVAESFHPHGLRDLVLHLRGLAIPDEQIIRLRLDVPEKI